jgi:hypothetical protein
LFVFVVFILFLLFVGEEPEKLEFIIVRWIGTRRFHFILTLRQIQTVIGKTDVVITIITSWVTASMISTGITVIIYLMIRSIRIRKLTRSRDGKS